MGVSENVVYPIVPNGFADHEIPFLNGYFIGNINPTFSGPNPYVHLMDVTPAGPNFDPDPDGEHFLGRKNPWKNPP